MYSIIPIPIPPSTLQIAKFASIRLLALKTDPSSFGSTYAREIAFTPDQWRARLSTADRATFVASLADPAQAWVATASVLVPSAMIADAVAPLGAAGVAGAVYMVVGMWVHPGHRRKGLGRGLVEQVAVWIRGHVRAGAGDWGGEGEQKAVMVLQVSDEDARKLYVSMGFTLVPGVLSDHDWMVAPVS